MIGIESLFVWTCSDVAGLALGVLVLGLFGLIWVCDRWLERRRGR